MKPVSKPRIPKTLQKTPQNSSRRQFLAKSGQLIASSVLAGTILPRAFAAEDNTIRLALVGCGGRGTGAIKNALSSPTGPVKLVAMADLFEEKLAKSYEILRKEFGERIDVPEDRRFLGFDAYRKAIDCLRPGDVLVQTTHAAFRPLHFAYGVEKGVHVFMEKSFAPDPGGTHEILRLGEEAEKKNLKVGCGLMCRHSSARQALIQKIREGAVGDVLLIRAYRMDSDGGMKAFPGGESELLWQIRHPGGFHWVGSGKYVDWNIHQIDECCWIKDAWPVSAMGLGGRGQGIVDCGQAYHTYTVEYTFPDGAKAIVHRRSVPDCYNDFSTFLHGTKCAAQFSGRVHAPTVQIYKSQQTIDSDIDWRPENEAISPYQVEWDVLLDAIRKDQPHNEVKRSAYANLAALMGRAAVHTGKIITWDEMMNSTFKFCPDVGFTMDSAAPVQADASGQYPVPVPGQWKET